MPSIGRGPPVVPHCSHINPHPISTGLHAPRVRGAGRRREARAHRPGEHAWFGTDVRTRGTPLSGHHTRDGRAFATSEPAGSLPPCRRRMQRLRPLEGPASSMSAEAPPQRHHTRMARTSLACPRRRGPDKEQRVRRIWRRRNTGRWMRRLATRWNWSGQAVASLAHKRQRARRALGRLQLILEVRGWARANVVAGRRRARACVEV